ncbi:MAG: GAF domain-containing sensor histidine kinase [Acidobacteriota bacterium]|nr:GAF domain-containing sensor histidine kinase [Acidobacteriota bacterium]
MVFHKIQDPARLHALIEAILLIEVDTDLDDLLASIVGAAMNMVGARYGALGVVASDGKTLSRFITQGIDEPTRSAIGPLPCGEGVLGEVIHRDSALRVDDLTEYQGFRGFPAHHPPMFRFLGAPVETGDGHVFGTIYLTDPLDDEPFDAEDEILIEAFGRAAGLVIDQATLRAHLRELTLSEERERLARDLHDTVIQRLFGVGLALQIALGGQLDGDARARVNQCIDELDTTIREIRTTIFEIDRDEEEAGPLSARIESLADEVRERLGIEVAVAIAPDLDRLISAHCAHHVIQALREMLSNVARHSQADAARVDVTVVDEMVSVSVADDGVGFSSAAGPGHGLRNLTTRAAQLGGEFVVDASPGRGTLVRWTAKRQA